MLSLWEAKCDFAERSPVNNVDFVSEIGSAADMWPDTRQPLPPPPVGNRRRQKRRAELARAFTLD